MILLVASIGFNIAKEISLLYASAANPAAIPAAVIWNLFNAGIQKGQELYEEWVLEQARKGR